MSIYQKFIKRVFDILIAIIGLILVWWLIFLLWLVASLDTRSNGFFTQTRVGKNGKLFKIIKIKTMRADPSTDSTVTVSSDLRITKTGHVLRKFKLDELPQLWNVARGDMSFVGPRPDVPGFADALPPKLQLVLSVRPGITGPASLKYKDEEYLLSMHPDPISYNREVIWPDKVEINIQYIENWSFYRDLFYMFKTLG